MARTSGRAVLPHRGRGRPLPAWGLVFATTLCLSLGASGPGRAQAAAEPNQVESVILARGIRPASLFGSNLLTPVGATTTFVSTDLPYAIVRIKAPTPDVTVSFELISPSGPAYTIHATMPPHRVTPQDFDFAAPLYILGTDFERDTGNWRLRVSVNGALPQEATFQWLPGGPVDLSGLKAQVNADPLNADLRWRYGAALALFGRDQDSIRELQAAIRLDPHYALYHITLGRVYEREGRRAEAVREFEAVLSLRGSHYDAIFSGWARAHLTRLKA